ncbi:MAG: nodulation protein NfeD [Desulfobacteraceae bacterium]|nr:nodulation protein NfeD [Desulfobacteraceae bacterium]MDH3573125.1 nodulation protein NfeD [Desulfobacteraceae bacterium]MDH3836019.1 nodulation protein NfeD [Desulfobacteraceae bacterium]MDH3872855.1 nodulation protein NfeD [Desulfobacteraceae bacterium]PLX48014.1 MAG: serine protease [Desulfobacteraceae bacterium]
MKRLILILPAFLLFLCCFPGNNFAAENEVYVIEISGSINPAVADFLKKGINQASADGVSCVIIKIDTPGGLAESMRIIVKAIFASKVPVVTYVAPSGARAASAGVMITIAADIAAMAPGTNIGAAHPVGAGGKDIGGKMSEKVTNDMVAHVKSIAQKRGRNVQWVEKAVRESVSVTETEALKANVIDIVAKDLDDLIRQINGRKIENKGVLKLDNPKKTMIEESFRTKVLKIISDPNVAYILMMIGLAGLYFELSHPGAVLPGVVGGISIILAFFAFQTIPVNYAGFLLIILAIVFFIMEMKIASYGLLSIAGITSLLLGSLMLFESNGTDMRLSWKVLVPTLMVVSGFFVAISGLVFKSQLSKPKTGARGLLGEIGVVKEPILQEGKVFVHGELWKAISKDSIEKGAKVRVLKIENLVLEVEPIE